MPLLLFISRHVLFLPCCKFVVEIQSSPLSIAYLGSTFICFCSPLDSLNFHTSKHSTCSASCVWVFFLFLSNVIFVAPTISRWFIETHRHRLWYHLVSLAPPSSFDRWVSLTHISGSEHMCVITSLCFLVFQCPPSTSRSPYDSLCVVITDFELSRLLAHCFSLSLSPPYHLICLVFTPYPLLSLFSSRLLCSLLCFSLLRASYATYIVSHALCSCSPLS